MWRWWRTLYLLAYWALVALLIALTVWAWRAAPGRFLGIAWVWYAGIFLVAFAAVALDATLELPVYPLPPEVPPAVERRRWLSWLLLGWLTSAMFLLLFLPLMLAVQGLRLLVAGQSIWVRKLAVGAGTLIVVGWLIGVFRFLAWLQDQPVITRLQDRLASLNTITAQDVAAMLRKVDLPIHQREAWLKRLHREGLTEVLALELLEDLQSYLKQEDNPIRKGRYAQLMQLLHRYLEAPRR